jgi:hypothetical protein
MTFSAGGVLALRATIDRERSVAEAVRVREEWR